MKKDLEEVEKKLQNQREICIEAQMDVNDLKKQNT